MRHQPTGNSIVPTIALPETRQLDVLARLLESRHMSVVRCPLVAIHDSPEKAKVEAWLQRFVSEPPDLFVIYTGEGIYRLQRFAERVQLQDEFVIALKDVALLTRGPKPVRALRALGMKPTYEATAPTTTGVIDTLNSLDISDLRVCVQLYGSDPNETLMSYLGTRSVSPDCVAPYVYASESDESQVIALIEKICARTIDAIAFTSKSQIDRLLKVARRAGRDTDLRTALGLITVAAVGPIVEEELIRHGVRVDVIPSRSFHMKPLVQQLVRHISANLLQQQ